MANNENASQTTGKITVNTAIELTSNWRTYLRKSEQGFQTKAFLIPIESLNHLINQNSKADSVRVYLGLENVDDPSTATLILVPVINDTDVIYIPGGSDNGDSEDDSNVYDRTGKCPPDCGTGNELNGN